ncbi:hypothetical protein BaRGS_00039120 [Batillaria attramentaria]|uniref:Uncharacterized protein n=1 Tax=Batillaria attramentaria TaxID=370345 RepID=A0ABD0J434_9CAEN
MARVFLFLAIILGSGSIFPKAHVTADVLVQCEKFKDGEQGSCTCTVNSTELDSDKCILTRPVTSVNLALETNRGFTVRVLCVFENYVTGQISQKLESAICSSKRLSEDLYILEAKILANRMVHEGASVYCEPYCLDASYLYGLDTTEIGIPIQFADGSTDKPTARPSGDPDGGPNKDVWYIVIGVSAALTTLLVVAVVVLWIYRRKRARKRKESVNPADPRLKTESVDLPSTVSAEQSSGQTGPYATLNTDDIGVASAYDTFHRGGRSAAPTCTTATSAEQTGPYASLDPKDVGMPSAYDAISHESKSTAANGGKATQPAPNPQYETLLMKDVGMKSPYTTIGQGKGTQSQKSKIKTEKRANKTTN